MGSIAFLSKRMIDENDNNHKTTTSSLININKGITSLRATVKEMEHNYELMLSQLREIETNQIKQKKITPAQMGDVLGVELDKKISGLNLNYFKMQKEITLLKTNLDKVLEQVSENAENHGEILWIKQEIADQNVKMKGLYDAMTKMLGSRKR